MFISVFSCLHQFSVTVCVPSFASDILSSDLPLCRTAAVCGACSLSAVTGQQTTQTPNLCVCVLMRGSVCAWRTVTGFFYERVRKDTSTSTPEKSPEEMPESEERKPNKTQQLKKVFKEYGAVGVSFHIGMSLMSLGLSYLLVSSGIDMAAILCKVGFSEAVVQSKMAAGTSTFVLAYAIHKLFAPVRISITLVSVPLIVRYLRKTGLFKPPTPAP
uniref:Family with sequence similarity 210 member B n=1 Tax=Oryzias latipes TaxID=8090 RepID=A0A3P9HVY5_ORYLA